MCLRARIASKRYLPLFFLTASLLWTAGTAAASTIGRIETLDPTTLQATNAGFVTALVPNRLAVSGNSIYTVLSNGTLAE